MKSLYRFTTHVLLFTFVGQTVLASPLYADHIFARIARMGKESQYCGTPPAMCEDSAIETLAENIDWLEHHIDCYGSVVAKQPDIWGEARLTKHRDEYERILYQELNQFEFTLNAAISQSDQSYASAALALSNAVSENGSAPKTPLQVNVQGQETVNLENGEQQPTSNGSPITGVNLTKFDGSKINIEPTTYLDQMSRYVNHLHELRRINEGDDTSDSPGYALNLVRIPISLTPGKITREGWGAEITITADPVLSDDLLPTTFRNLVVNDLVDQLRLPLVKMVENKAWQEITKQESDEEVKVFKRLLVQIEQNIEAKNQLKACRENAIEELTERVAKLKAEVELKGVELAQSNDKLEVYSPGTDALREYLESVDEATIDAKVFQARVQGSEELRKLVRSELELLDSTGAIDLPSARSAVEGGEFLAVPVSAKGIPWFEFENRAPDELKTADVRSWAKRLEQDTRAAITEKEAQERFIEERTKQYQDIEGEIEGLADQIEGLNSSIEQINTSKADLQRDRANVQRYVEERAKSATYGGFAAPTSRARRARHPLSPSSAIQILDFGSLKEVARNFCRGYQGRHVRWAGSSDGCDEEFKGESRVHILDAERWLQAEIEAAHDMLSDPDHVWIFYRFAHPSSGLAAAIHGHHIENGNGNQTEAHGFQSVKNLRNCFFNLMQSEKSRGTHRYQAMDFDAHEVCDEEKHASSTTEALAWAIVVESALLNHRLNEDVRKTAVARDCGCIQIGHDDLVFFLPGSAAHAEGQFSGDFHAATKVFQEYVKCRWPIHVFALDPRESDQNVADVSARRRELQLALSMGFVSGEISANTLMNYSRQLETQVETISLNRTISSFSHGNDTFGWRFYPRVQALDQPGAVGTIWQSFRGTPRDRDVCKRQIEPGMRECVAIVLMPSFVPYADFDVRSNWFRLHNPRNAALTMKDTVKLSRAITSMRRSKARCSQCAHLYRDGEVKRLMKRVHQLDRELPLQSMRTQVPYENTLGGFEMFNTGVTDLAPELIGWYGAPGVTITDDGVDPYTCGCNTNCPISDTDTTAKAISAAIAAHNDANHSDTARRDKLSPFPICEGQGTTLFLVGDNFSVHDTKVIAGGVCIPHVRLISREIMRVTIPSCVNTVEVDGKEYIAVYASTPYGVTNHLHIPKHTRETSKKKKEELNSTVEAQVKAQLPKLVRVAVETALVDVHDLVVTAKGDGMKATATCDTSNGQSGITQVKISPTDLIVGLSPLGPRVAGKKVDISLALKANGMYFTGTIPIGTVTVPAQQMARDFKIPLDTDPSNPDALEQLQEALTNRYSDVSKFKGKDKKVDLSGIVYFKLANSPGIPHPAKGSVPITVTLVCDCCDPDTSAAPTTTASASSTNVSSPTPTTLLKPVLTDGSGTRTENIPAGQPTTPESGPSLPAPTTDTSSTSSTSDCNCSALRVLNGSVR